MDFVEDVRAGLARELQELGYELPAPTGDAYKDAHRICVDHWNAIARRVSVRARTVHWSRELRVRDSQLAAAMRAGLASVAQALERGDDVTPKLSRKVIERTFNDKMLHDWGIHHLHLGDTIEGDGFAKRTGDVLFVMIQANDAYLIDVRGHTAWTDEELVDIIHTNWPETIARFRYNAHSLHHMLTPQDRKNLRSKNANAAVATKDGTIYGGLGGGLVGSGDNVRAILWGDHTLRMAKSVQESMSTMAAEGIADEVLAATGARPRRLVLRLAALAHDHAVVLVECAAKPFAIRIPFEQPEPVTIEVRS
jgi:hypothetical protein